MKRARTKGLLRIPPFVTVRVHPCPVRLGTRSFVAQREESDVASGFIFCSAPITLSDYFRRRIACTHECVEVAPARTRGHGIVRTHSSPVIPSNAQITSALRGIRIHQRISPRCYARLADDAEATSKRKELRFFVGGQRGALGNGSSSLCKYAEGASEREVGRPFFVRRGFSNGEGARSKVCPEDAQD